MSIWDMLASTWPAQVGQTIAQALMAPGNAYKSTPDNPVTTEQMVGPAADLAGLVTGIPGGVGGLGSGARVPPIVQFRKDAADIVGRLPPVPEGFTRLWRGNRPNEVGAATQFTNDLPGIALPFSRAYGGEISYVDVPLKDLPKHQNVSGAASGAEFNLPRDIASRARVLGFNY